MSFQIGVFADRKVGKETIAYLLNYYSEQLSIVCLTDKKSTILPYLYQNNYPQEQIYFWDDLQNEETQEKIKSLHLQYIVLAWWPYIIKKEILQLPEIGMLNFHPSLLPYNKGKNYNFWNLVEEVPFGVTIHFVDEGIDSGDIIFQKKIPVSWEDTGKSLYEKAQTEMIQLFKENYDKLADKRYALKKQNSREGSFHLGKEMEEKSVLDLNASLTVREVLNLLRARSFKPYPGCRFYDKGKIYEVHIQIKEIIEESGASEESNRSI